MFEVGKLSDESIDALLNELEQISLLDSEEDGEVSRYFTHAVNIKNRRFFFYCNISFLDIIAFNHHVSTKNEFVWFGFTTFRMFG